MDFTFDDINGDGRIWAVKYHGNEQNELDRLFDDWSNVELLHRFFTENKNDLVLYFKPVNVQEAILDTIEDNEDIQAVFLDMDSEMDLDSFFIPLVDGIPDSYLERSKGKRRKRRKHASWVRIYALKLEKNRYLITGGAIKLTPLMQERPHTLAELHKLFYVRKSLKEEQGIIDGEGFDEFIKDK